jgi:GNAT superfamily N-acetyltransferase
MCVFSCPLFPRKGGAEMIEVKTSAQFMQLRNFAVKERGWRLTNFLMPDSEIEAFVRNDRVRYEKTDACLCVIVNRHGSDCLHWWTGDSSAAFIPDGANNKVFSYYGIEGKPSIWAGIPERLGLRQAVKAQRFGAKCTDLTLPRPAAARDDFRIEVSGECSYDDFTEMTSPYFHPIYGDVPERLQWEDCLKGFSVAKAYCRDGALAGFYMQNKKGRKITGKELAVVPEYRGRGLAALLFADAASRCDFIEGWIQSDNMTSIAMHTKFGMKYDGVYRIFCI